MPKVSVIISTYNRAHSHFVCDAIDSVLKQTFKDFEIIVVDDGSTDNTRQVLEKYGSNINYVYQQNMGRAETRNTGIKQAKGEYIAFLDDDDIWLPSKLQKQVAFLDSCPDIGLVHTFLELNDKQGCMLPKETKSCLKAYKKAMKLGYTYEQMSRLCVMTPSATMVRSRCLEKTGLFDPTVETCEDWDFYLRFALEYRIGTIAEPLVRIRFHETQTAMGRFTQGRINTAMKHLAILEFRRDFFFRNSSCYNFYIHLANAYYIAMNWKDCQKYTWEALKLSPLALFQSRLGVHLLMTLLPVNLLKIMRNLKGSFNA
jgi:glycosyltransferase involved in cell wall biosynthesis